MPISQLIFKGTLFEGVNELFTLKLPSKKSFPVTIIPKLQALALSFYSFVFEKIIKTSSKCTILENYPSNKQPIREAYTNLFYSLSSNSQKNLDFIASIICLLSQVIITTQKLQQDKNIYEFIEVLTKNEQKMRDFMFVLYTFETLACKVSKQSAKIIFDKYIIQEKHANKTSIGTKMKVSRQLKQVKENLENNHEYVLIRPRIKKIGKQKNFQQELKSLMDNNKMQLEQQNKNSIKFHKYLSRCMTQGKIDFNPRLIRKQSKIKISSFLKTIKNIQTLARGKKKQYANRNSEQRSYQYWSSVIGQMKNLQFLTKRQRIQALSSVNTGQKSCNNNLTIQYEQKHTPSYIIPQEEEAENKKERAISHKKTRLQFKSSLPDIKLYKDYKTPIQKNTYLTPLKNTQNSSSRKLKKQLEIFLNERNSKQY